MRFPAAFGARVLVSAVLAGTALAGGTVAATAAPSTAARLATARLAASSAPAATGSAERPTGGVVTGLVLGSGRTPLAGACVTASGPAGTESAITSGNGRYILPGLRAGTYTIRYRACSAPLGADPADVTRQVVLTGQQVTDLAPETLPSARPVAGQIGTATPRSRAPRRISLAALRRRFAQIATGGLSGRVTDPAGHPLRNICVDVITSFGFIGTSTSAKGTFDTSTHFLPPGKYAVEFTPTCIPGEKPAGNWAPEWYRGKYSQSGADKITIRAGRITRAVNAVMQPGGQITGSVTGAGGGRLTGVCVDLLTGNGRGYVTQAKTARGSYRIAALDPGTYRVAFNPCSKGTAKYLGQWWPGASKTQGANAVRVRLSEVTPGIDAVLALGGTITGTVRFKNGHGRPLAGICVYGTGLGDLGASDFGSVNPGAVTAKNGSYVMDGMPTGRYSVMFETGCKNNGNYLNQDYPHPVSVTAGKTAGGVNASLQPGGTVSGTVTAAATGKPLRGICVDINAGFGGGTRTDKTGSFRMDQLPPGRYSVEFSGGCGNSGSYAPQWFPGRTKQFNAALVTIRADRVTSGIDAAMRAGATLSGTVTNSSGTGLSGICVMAADADNAGFVDETGLFLEDTQTGGTGRYRIVNLAAGQYQVAFFYCGFNGGPGYVTQWFPSQRSEEDAGMLDVPAAASVTGLNAAMTRGGAISGTIKAPGFTGQSLDICITATNRATHISTQTESGSNTSTAPYAIGGLAAGRYTVRFDDCGGNGYATQWYRGQASPGAANPVTVQAGRTAHSVGAVLKRGEGSIAGRVTVRRTGKPAAGICVLADSPAGGGYANVSRAGDYVLRHLPPGRYRLSFFACTGHSPYADQTRPGFVEVTSSRPVSGVDFAVSLGGSITGTVRGGSPAVPEPAVCVEAVPEARGGISGYAVTMHGGRYDITGLLAGRYLVQFSDVQCSDDTEGLAPQWYSGQSSQASATPVMVRAGAATTGIGGTLARDGSVTGTVTGPAPASTPLSGICVQAVPVNSRAGTLDQVDPVAAVTQAGSYTLAGVIPGHYRVEFSSGCGATGYAGQWWANTALRANATIIAVSPATTTTSINAAMGS
jgi:hypothetical protein